MVRTSHGAKLGAFSSKNVSRHIKFSMSLNDIGLSNEEQRLHLTPKTASL